MRYTGKDLILGGLFCALALVFPVLFHAIGVGSMFLPMFIPILMAGFVLPLPVAITVGLASPFISALLTGMPPFYPPMVFIMMIEGIILSSIPVLLYQKIKANVYLTLAVTLVVDRLILFGAVFLAGHLLGLPSQKWGWTMVIKGIPGIVMILVVFPPLIVLYKKTMRQAFV